MQNQLGAFKKIILKPEKKILKSVRRSVFSRHKIKKNEVITTSNIKFLRDESKKDFLNLRDFVGKKLKKKINSNKILNKNNIF